MPPPVPDPAMLAKATRDRKRSFSSGTFGIDPNACRRSSKVQKSTSGRPVPLPFAATSSPPAEDRLPPPAVSVSSAAASSAPVASAPGRHVSLPPVVPSSSSAVSRRPPPAVGALSAAAVPPSGAAPAAPPASSAPAVSAAAPAGPPPAAASASPAADSDGFVLVAGRSKRRSPLARPHPAVLALRGEAPLPGAPPPSCLLFYPAGAESLHKAPRGALCDSLEALSPGITGVRRIRKGGLAVDFPPAFDLSPLLSLSSLAGLPVRASLPKPRKGSLGTIRGSFSSPEELIELLAYHSSSNPPVHDCKRLGSSNVWVLHFVSDSLPPKVLVFYDTHRVSPYFSPPLQCYRCHRFGHSVELCRGAVVCGKCGERGHTFKACKAEKEFCVNCAGSHHTRSRACPHRVFNVKVEKHLAKTRCSRVEARRAIATLDTAPSPSPPLSLPLSPPSVSPPSTYAAAVAGPPRDPPPRPATVDSSTETAFPEILEIDLSTPCSSTYPEFDTSLEEPTTDEDGILYTSILDFIGEVQSELNEQEVDESVKTLFSDLVFKYFARQE